MTKNNDRAATAPAILDATGSDSHGRTTPEAPLPAGFKRRADGDLMDASRQWANRPADEAVATVDELVARTTAVRRACRDKADVAWDSLRVEPVGRELALVGRGGKPAQLTNFAAGQLCGLPCGDGETAAPLGFLRKLSTPLAAQVLNERLSHGVARKRDANLLVKLPTDSGDPLTVRSITTAAYERVWDVELATRVADLCRRSSWGPAEAFRKAGGGQVTHAWGQPGEALPLGWVGDRSSFIALVDYDGAVDVGGSKLARFVLLSNSEVGAGSLKVTFGLLDFVCCNFILWGAKDVVDWTGRHTATIRERMVEAFAPMSRRMGSGERDELRSGIVAAQAHLLGPGQDETIAVVRAATALPKAIVADAYVRAEATSRYGDPRSVWGMVNGLTEASQHVAKGYADKRAAIDAAAARLMGLL
jgi:hypothetical protein